MSPCAGCMKARRYLINKTPKGPIREKLTRTFLPPDAPPTPPLPTVTTGAEVVREARSWVGVPFRHQGRDRNGVDCWGLPVVVLRELGALPAGFDTTHYPRSPSPGDLEARLVYCTPLAEPMPGCLIGIRWQRTGAHVAIYTDTDTLIHALERHQKVIEHGFRGMWRTRFYIGAWALPGVRYG
jgi:cell wall-associated NlpC family hydrolase